ncbi:MFS transporter [Phyllobacterium sp. YR531]|uniref:MFS transporter n=1 Tax=Phyllobacterium sp. YR531 TaxID=1144343 RepID=UPI00026FB1EE|nr:MFS transporter [Phyllobacterium sp. YR531]EJN05823.1 arabinose efflux permease family protein [Phyllobacterium sp. YR531]
MSESNTAGSTQISVSRSSKRAVVIGSVGNALELYDFGVYGFVATIIASKFFPNDDPTASLLATFAAFGIGFFFRPLGAILIGRLGDTKGRKPALLITILLMAIGTVGIGLIPAFETIGLMAPVLLVLCRILQGFSVGGEWGGATAYIVEWAPPGRRGLFGSFQQFSAGVGLLLGSTVAALTSSMLSDQAMLEWGWRVPFLIGGILLPFGLYMRRDMEESPAFEKAKNLAPENLAKPKLSAMLNIGMFSAGWVGASYVTINYMPTFTQRYLNVSRTEALWMSTVAITVMTLSMPFWGHLSDKIGRKPVVLLAAVGLAVLSYPLFHLLTVNAETTMLYAVQCVFALLVGAFSGAGPAMLAEMVSTSSRTTGMSVGYGLAVAVFGGSAPFIATWLVGVTNSPASPTYFLILTAILSIIAIARVPETSRQELH